jgi:hypothetical protein
MNNNKWWLISDANCRAISQRLSLAIAHAGDGELLAILQDAQHLLDSGLNSTDAVPSDFAEDKRVEEQALTAPDQSPWYEEMQEFLADLEAINPKAFLQWTWYCRNSLNLDPKIVPPTYLKTWLKLPPCRREMGY